MSLPHGLSRRARLKSLTASGSSLRDLKDAATWSAGVLARIPDHGRLVRRNEGRSTCGMVVPTPVRGGHVPEGSLAQVFERSRKGERRLSTVVWQG